VTPVTDPGHAPCQASGWRSPGAPRNYFRQARNGVFVRMALLAMLLDKG